MLFESKTFTKWASMFLIILLAGFWFNNQSVELQTRIRQETVKVLKFLIELVK